ncbi:hypothetical protein [Rhodovibrio sodomensis]|uniref:hypothetical protein n=1 Tax=Rhodovibrio sodomensis TaxID=1088 RepID=UPI0019057CE5|nr:hypothetical protein [Rhodovibrio sodomensis]
MKTALLVLLLLSLTACQAFPPGSGGDAGDPDAGSVSDGEAEVVSGLDPSAQDRAERARDRRMPPPRPPELPPRGQLGEDRLTGLTTSQTWDLLGPPSEVEEQSPATVWTYEVAGCRLELFFYFDLESQQQRTLALDLEAASDFVGSRPFCWYTLAERGRTRAAPLPQADSGRNTRDSARVPTAGQLDGASTDQASGAEGAPADDAEGQSGPADDAAAESGTDANAPSEGENAQ